MLCGALKPKPSHRPAVEPGPGANDPAALAVLDRAVAALDPARVQWLQAKVWHRAECEDFCFQACGRLLTAPGERSRYDLNVKVGKSVGELRVVCDGQGLWQSLRVGGNKAMVRRWELPATPEQAAARLQLLRSYGFGGLAPMLRGLRECARGARSAPLRWNGREVIVVALAIPNVEGESAADYVPARLQLRQCCLFLDAQTLWPHRVEWWGAEDAGRPNRLLMQTEYRGAVLNQPLSAERCAAEFTFSPG